MSVTNILQKNYALGNLHSSLFFLAYYSEKPRTLKYKLDKTSFIPNTPPPHAPFVLFCADMLHFRDDMRNAYSIDVAIYTEHRGLETILKGAERQCSTACMPLSCQGCSNRSSVHF